jgi:hypothetical protein
MLCRIRERVNDTEKHDTEKVLPKSVTRFVFLGLLADGQKGIRRGRRKHMNLVALNFRFRWFIGLPFDQLDHLG